MEKCVNIEEKFVDGERELIFHYESKDLKLNENNLLNLLIGFESIGRMREYFSNIKLDDVLHYLDKNNIKYIVA